MMTFDTSSRDAVVTAALRRASSLAMLPETATRVIQLASDPNVTMGRLAEVIETSPELCARILRIVNSAFYGFPGEVRSIQRATTLMGLESVRNVTVAASLTRVFQGRSLSATFSPKDIWTHSVAVGTATRLLAEAAVPTLAEEAFLAGMLHDIGLMMELQMDRAKLSSVVAVVEAGQADVLGAEEAAFGATHQDFGAALLTAWGLPSSLSITAQYHHSPLPLPAQHRLVPALVYTAERLVAGVDRVFLLDDRSSIVSDDLLECFSMSRDRLVAVTTELPAALDEGSRLFVQ